jgi:hypothetical protein
MVVQLERRCTVGKIFLESFAVKKERTVIKHAVITE